MGDLNIKLCQAVEVALLHELIPSAVISTELKSSFQIYLMDCLISVLYSVLYLRHMKQTTCLPDIKNTQRIDTP